MPRIVIVQYLVMAAAWLLTLIAWPLQAVEYRYSIGLYWTRNTSEFVQNQCEYWWSLIQKPAAISPLGMLHMLLLSLTLVGFATFILGVSLVRRRFIWPTTARQIIRGFSLTLLALPLSLLMPANWNWPQPLPGMYLLATAHVLMCAALWITPAKLETAGFPVEPSAKI